MVDLLEVAAGLGLAGEVGGPGVSIGGVRDKGRPGGGGVRDKGPFCCP